MAEANSGRGGYRGNNDRNKNQQRDTARDLPGVPKPPMAPDRTAFQNKMGKKRDEIQVCRTKLNDIRDKLASREVDPEREAYYARQKKLTTRMREVQEIIRQERDSRAVVSKQMRETRLLREELESKLHTLTGELGTFKDIDEIQMAISMVELRLETEGKGSLRQEKEFLRRRKLLESAKVQVDLLKPLREHIEMCSDKELEVLQEAKSLQKRLDELNAELREVSSKKTSENAPTKSRDAVNALKEERTQLYNTMAKAHEEMDQIRAAYDLEEVAWRKKMDEWRIILDKARKERDELRKKRDEERARKQKEMDSIRKLNPHEDKIDTCSTLIRYLEDKISIHKAQPKREVKSFQHVDPMDRFKKDENDGNDWLFQDRRKKLGMGRNKTKPAGQMDKKMTQVKKADPKDFPLKMDIQRLMSFEKLEIEAPRMSSQALKTIEVLKEKKEYYKKFIISEIEAAAVEALEQEKKEAEEPKEKDAETKQPDVPVEIKTESKPGKVPVEKTEKKVETPVEEKIKDIEKVNEAVIEKKEKAEEPEVVKAEESKE